MKKRNEEMYVNEVKIKIKMLEKNLCLIVTVTLLK